MHFFVKGKRNGSVAGKASCVKGFIVIKIRACIYVILIYVNGKNNKEEKRKIAEIILEENMGDLVEQENDYQRLSLFMITGIAFLTIIKDHHY